MRRKQWSIDLKTVLGPPNSTGSGVYFSLFGVDQIQIEAAFSAAIRTAREQKSISLAKHTRKQPTQITAVAKDWLSLWERTAVVENPNFAKTSAPKNSAAHKNLH